jgi:hypothetical protein
VDSAASQPQPQEVTGRGVSIPASDAVCNDFASPCGGGDAVLHAKGSSGGRDASVLPTSPCLMSAASRVAWGGVVLVILWAAIFWAVRA